MPDDMPTQAEMDLLEDPEVPEGTDNKASLDPQAALAAVDPIREDD